MFRRERSVATYSSRPRAMASVGGTCDASTAGATAAKIETTSPIATPVISVLQVSSMGAG